MRMPTGHHRRAAGVRLCPSLLPSKVSVCVGDAVCGVHCFKYGAHPHPEHWLMLLLCVIDSRANSCLALSYVLWCSMEAGPMHCRRTAGIWGARGCCSAGSLGIRWGGAGRSCARPVRTQLCCWSQRFVAVSCPDMRHRLQRQRVAMPG